MDSNCKKAIRSLMQELKEILSVSIKDFISLLHKDSKGFLSTVEVKRVRGQTQPMDQVQELLDILLTKTTDDFYTFCNVLESSNNQWWADELRSQAGSNLAKPSGAKASGGKKKTKASGGKKKTKAARKSGHSSSTSPKPQAQHGNGLKQDEEKVEVSNPDIPEKTSKWNRFKRAACWVYVLCAFFILVDIFIFERLPKAPLHQLCESMGVFRWFPEWLEAYREVVVKIIATAIIPLLSVLLCALKRTCSSPASSQSPSFERPWPLSDSKHGELLVKMDKWSDMKGCIIRGRYVGCESISFTAFVIKWFGQYYFVTAYHIYYLPEELPKFENWRKKFDPAIFQKKFLQTACSYYLVNEANEHPLPIRQLFIDFGSDIVVAPIELDEYPKPWLRQLDHGIKGDWKNLNFSQNIDYFNALEMRTVSILQYIDGELYRSSGDIFKCTKKNWKLQYKARTEGGSSGAALIVTVPDRKKPNVNWPMIIGVHSGSSNSRKPLNEGFFLFPFLDQVRKDIEGIESLDLNYYSKLDLPES